MIINDQMETSDYTLIEEQPLDGLVNDPGGGSKRSKRLEKSGEVFDLAVAEGMFLIGGLVRGTHSKVGRRGCNQIQAGMGGFRQDAKRVGQKTNDKFKRG